LLDGGHHHLFISSCVGVPTFSSSVSFVSRVARVASPRLAQSFRLSQSPPLDSRHSRSASLSVPFVCSPYSTRSRPRPARCLKNIPPFPSSLPSPPPLVLFSPNSNTINDAEINLLAGASSFFFSGRQRATIPRLPNPLKNQPTANTGRKRARRGQDGTGPDGDQ